MNFTTLLSRSSSSIFAHISKTSLERDAVLLFSLSANASNLEAITSRLCRLAPQTIGCLSSPHPSAPDIVMCSMATFPARDCVSFRSSIPGRPPVQVGRWNRKRESGADAFDLPSFPAKGDDFWEFGADPQLPAEFLGHERDIKSLLFFSDDAPEGFVKSLRAIPEANKLGLVASSTPFATGRPFSLFHNQSIYSSGAVGLALRNHIQPASSTSFLDLIPISSPMRVSKSESNLIHELNYSNPSKMLVEALAADRTGNLPTKEEEFFLGRIHSEHAVKDRISRVYRILSGDPSRGSIALEAERAPQENEMVQFFRRAPHGSSTTLASWQMQNSDNPSLRFLCSSKEEISAHETYVTDGDDVQVLRNTFLAMSENGFLCTEATSSKPLWKCVVPGAIGSLEWVDC